MCMWSWSLNLDMFCFSFITSKPVQVCNTVAPWGAPGIYKGIAVSSMLLRQKRQRPTPQQARPKSLSPALNREPPYKPNCRRQAQ